LRKQLPHHLQDLHLEVNLELVGLEMMFLLRLHHRLHQLVYFEKQNHQQAEEDKAVL
jgi:hypothetical protein